MPRAFLIKKHSPVRETTLFKPKSVDGDNENALSIENTLATMDLSPTSEHRGPYDLSVKAQKLSDLEKDEPPAMPQPPIPRLAVQFSPKILTSSSVATPPIGIALIDRRTPSPNHILKAGAPLEPLNPNTPPSSGTPPWHKPFMGPTYPPFSFPLYPLARHATDLYASSSPYLAAQLLSPPLMALSPPQSTSATALEENPSCFPRENVSPGSSSFYGRHSIPDSMRADLASTRPEFPVYHSPWIHKDGSTSPLPRSDSSDSGRDSASNSKSSGSVESCSSIPRYQCIDCSKSYSTYSGLSRHRQFHCVTQAKKSFNCKYCDKIYVSLGALKMHIRTHTLPCKCKICGKAFSRPWLLQGHIRTHTGEKPFACQHCSRAFADRSNLRAHLQTHSDVKKYNCKTCSKTFSRMSLLSKHCEGGCTATQSR